MALRTLVDDWFENVWNQKNEDHIRQHLAPDAVVHGLPMDDRCCPVDAFIQFQRTLLKAIPDTHVAVDRFISGGDEGIGFATVSGTDVKSGNRVQFKFAFWLRWDGTQILEAENIVDFLTYLDQGEAGSTDVLANHLS